MILNTLAALLEGISFSMILLALTSLGQNIESSFPLVISHFLERFSETSLFSVLVATSIIFQVFRSLFAYLGQIMVVRLGTMIQTEMQRGIFQQIFRLSFASVSRYRTGDLVDYVTAPTHFVCMITDAINRSLVAFLMILSLMVVMTCISLPLTLISFALFSLFIIFQRVIVKRMMHFSEKRSQQTVGLNKKTVQNLFGLRAIYTFNRQGQVLKEVDHNLAAIAKATRQVNYWNQLVLPFNEVVGILLVGAVLIIGPFFLKEKDSGLLPSLLTFLTLTYRLSTRLQIFTTGIRDVVFHYGPIKRMKLLLSNEDKEYEPKGGVLCKDTVSKIIFDRVSFTHKGQKKLTLKNINLVIPEGSVIALVGGSGAGKSSFLDLLLRLYLPTSGHILLDGINLSTFHVGSWREKFGVVAQNTILFNDTIANNIRFGNPTATDQEIEHAARLSCAHSFIDALPQKYATFIGDQGYRLSGGEKQRLALARALVRDPDILILDEATSHLDSHSENLIKQALETLKHQKTLIIVAHRLSTIVDADQIYVLKEGEISEAGTHQELLNQQGLYHSMWNLQCQNQPKMVEKFSKQSSILTVKTGF
ncbi:MAG: ABC transporter ATP-binding protein [Chlamydiia bacterium]|nr:ABC transporter ATP-binding protein [Chlamydiia bacterium]